jgi:hypothetical protein
VDAYLSTTTSFRRFTLSLSFSLSLSLSETFSLSLSPPLSLRTDNRRSAAPVSSAPLSARLRVTGSALEPHAGLHSSIRTANRQRRHHDALWSQGASRRGRERPECDGRVAAAGPGGLAHASASPAAQITASSEVKSLRLPCRRERRRPAGCSSTAESCAESSPPRRVRPAGRAHSVSLPAQIPPEHVAVVALRSLPSPRPPRPAPQRRHASVYAPSRPSDDPGLDRRAHVDCR